MKTINTIAINGSIGIGRFRLNIVIINTYKNIFLRATQKAAECKLRWI